jgi:hypothetical protein
VAVGSLKGRASGASSAGIGRGILAGSTSFPALQKDVVNGLPGLSLGSTLSEVPGVDQVEERACRALNPKALAIAPWLSEASGPTLE